MFFLDQTSSMVKIEHRGRADKCELCGSYRQLRIVPIYSLMHIASTYRQQRDMSPLWNTPLWHHFYQTTPTCTLCDDHARHYHAIGRNIPVDERRFQRLQARAKTPYQVVMASEFNVTPIDPEALKILRLWHDWTLELANGNDPKHFLPKYGFDGRTAAEIRRAELERQEAAQGDNLSLPALSDVSSERNEEDVNVAASRQLSKTKVKKTSGPAEDEDIGHDQGNPVDELQINWTEAAIMLAWLRRARQSLLAPQLGDWTRQTPLHEQLADSQNSNAS